MDNYNPNERQNTPPVQRAQYMAQMDSYNNYQHAYTHAVPQPKKRPLAGIIIACTLSAALLGGTVGGAVGLAIGSRLPNGSSAEVEANLPSYDTPAPVITAPAEIDYATLSSQALTYSQIAEKVSPSVVGITVKGTYETRTMFGTMQQPLEGAGSGIIYTADGYILTNAHVVDGADEIIISMASGDDYTARVVGSDIATDIAVLKIDAQNLPAIEIGSSNSARVGDVAVVVGNPLGELQGTVTQGIISAVNRELTIDGNAMSLLQTDAAMNEGNSGGALVNGQGQLIGIVNAKTLAVGVEGLGFAIPIDSVRDIIEDLKNVGYVTGRPMIGINTEDVTERISKAYNMPMGVYVARVESFSPAQKAGLQVGDIITAVNGEKVETTDELNEIKNRHNIGDTIVLTVVREGEELKINITLQESVPSN